MPPARRAPLERFAARTEQVGDCLIWRGTLYRNGYACFFDGDRNVLGHRWIYERCVGAIPDGMEIDHACNERACVNVEHLALVTHAENRRLSRERKTKCSHGHTFDAANTYWYRGNRYCRACRSVNEQASYRRRLGREAEAPRPVSR